MAAGPRPAPALALPRFATVMLWSRRLDSLRAHRWLRDTVTAACSGLGADLQRKRRDSTTRKAARNRNP